jgi:hypothetical protein
VNGSERELSAGEPDERRDDDQNPLTHTGAHPDVRPDSNEGADDKATVVQPDGSPPPRAKERRRRRRDT